MSKMKSLSIVVLLVMLFVGQSFGVIILPTGGDRIYSAAGYEYSNWTSGPNNGYTELVAGFNGSAWSRLFFHVPVSAGDFTVGDTATLNLTVTAPDVGWWGTALALSIHPVTTPYYEGSVTWEAADNAYRYPGDWPNWPNPNPGDPGTSFWTNPGGDYDVSVSGSMTMDASPGLGTFTADVTDIFNYWETNPNYGIIVVADDDWAGGEGNLGGSRYIGTSTHATAAPSIEVVPEPATLLLLAAGGFLIRRRRN